VQVFPGTAARWLWHAAQLAARLWSASQAKSLRYSAVFARMSRLGIMLAPGSVSVSPRQAVLPMIVQQLGRLLDPGYRWSLGK
jgi:hypothetical protein